MGQFYLEWNQVWLFQWIFNVGTFQGTTSWTWRKAATTSVRSCSSAATRPSAPRSTGRRLTSKWKNRQNQRQTKSETDRITDRQNQRQTESKTDRIKNRQNQRQTESKTDRIKDRQNQRQTESKTDKIKVDWRLGKEKLGKNGQAEENREEETKRKKDRKQKSRINKNRVIIDWLLARYYGLISSCKAF